MISNQRELRQQILIGGYCFYIVALIALLNAIYSIVAYDIHFLVGPILVQFFTGTIFTSTNNTIKSIGIVADMLIIGGIIILGYYAIKAKRWAFITGIILYSMDSFLYFGCLEPFGALFHIIILYFLFVGFRAIKPYRQLISSEN